MAIKLDIKDRKILYELDRNARLPASRIAKRVGLSTDVVNYRIKQLLRKGTIFKFMTLLDTAKLGLATYKVLYRFQNTTLEKEGEIIEYLARHPHSQLVATAEGNFDLNVNVLASNAEELNDILTGFNRRYGEYIAERQVNILVESHFFSRDYLIGQKIRDIRKPMGFGSKLLLIKMDEHDKKILALLAENARIPAVEISKHAGFGPDAVIQRIRKLERSGIIQNYVLFPNAEKIGYNWYYLLLRFRDFTRESERGFFSYCARQPHIWFYSKMIGPWDSVIGVDVENDRQFKDLLMTVKRNFSKIVKEYNILKIVKAYTFNQYPLR